MEGGNDSTGGSNAKYSPLGHSEETHTGGKSFVVYIQCYFVTIATILGTGILGLPVTLSHSGLYPFLITFIAGFFVQGLLIYFVTDILQRAHALQLRISKDDKEPENVPLYDIGDEEDWDEIEEEHETNGPVMAGHIIIPKDVVVQTPNLHLLGELFLCCGVRQVFDAVIIIQFIAFLISYALAGSEAYAQVIGIDHYYVIPVFVWVLTFFIVFFLSCIQPVVSVLTFAKGTLILATVVVTFFVGAAIKNEVTNDFTYIGAPFLMGTVALGGIMNVMPFLYAKVKPVQNQVKGYRWSLMLGLCTCAVINILWCWAVLDIVPQTNMCFDYEVLHNNSFHSRKKSGGDDQHAKVCAYNLSLESAAMNGEISTIPLTQIINNLYPHYNWVALLVQLFIMISITVSYLTIGAALYHTISGWIESIFSKDQFSHYTSKSKDIEEKKCRGYFNIQCDLSVYAISQMFKIKLRHCVTIINLKIVIFRLPYNERVCRMVIALIAFGVVFTIAMLNPKGFVQMLEKAASFFLNIEAGIFIFLMIRRARNSENKSLKIPLPLSTWQYNLQYILPIYFGFAIFYDVFVTIYELAYHGEPLPWEHKASNGVIIPISDNIWLNDSNSFLNETIATVTVS